MDRRRATTLITLGRDLATAAPSDDVLDLFAVACGVKPLAGIAACYTESGAPAWGPIDEHPDALAREALGERLDAAGFDWHMEPVKTIHEEAEAVTWYELLVSEHGQLWEFLEETGPKPGDRTEREYGDALGYPTSAIDWFVDGDWGERSVFDVIRQTRSDDALMLAASVPYVPAPYARGALEAIGDGRELTDALGQLDEAARTTYAETLLGERVDERLTAHDAALHTRWRDPLHRAMHA